MVNLRVHKFHIRLFAAKLGKVGEVLQRFGDKGQISARLLRWVLGDLKFVSYVGEGMRRLTRSKRLGLRIAGQRYRRKMLLLTKLSARSRRPLRLSRSRNARNTSRNSYGK